MKIIDFEIEDAFVNAIVGDILSDMRNCLELNGDLRILLSGGSTPIPIYNKLDQDCPFFNKIKIGLVDERFVPRNDSDSNERLLRNCFLKNSPASYDIKGMVLNDQNKTDNLRQVRDQYQLFIERTDIVVLGMGKDGHTASIFPNDQDSRFAMETNEITLFNTNAPNHPKDRITCGMDFLNKASNVYLIITGADKLKVLSDLENQLPIHTLLKKREDVKIYYLKDD